MIRWRASHVLLGAVMIAAGSARAGAQRSIPAADSALVARLLLAEERRDTSVAAYAEGTRHSDARIRVIARRAFFRSRDPVFALRDTLPQLTPPPAYGDPEWRLRYRQLGNRNENCSELLMALRDSTWPVRLRGADLVTSACATDTEVAGILRGWIRTVPTSGARARGGVSWHAAAHGLTALARIAQDDARVALPHFSTSGLPALRIYAARAATTLSDTATLRRLAADENDNVKEAAIDGLARVAGHAADDVMLSALTAHGYQAVRAAARALRETPMRDATLSAAITAAMRLRRDSSETSRDARRELVARIAELATPPDWPRIVSLGADFDCSISTAVAELGNKLGDQGVAPMCTRLPLQLPPDAVRLALGADVQMRVTMADSSGGGSFVVRLRGDIAPVMAARVLQLARAKYYDNLTWHRVEADFVIQGPSPDANEYVGYPRFFRDELGNVPHARGTVGMSTRGHDTGDAQWFVNLRDNFRLNKDYSIFAEVVEGIDVVDGILEGDVIARVEVIG
jgi:cyclophilin family peptidyl-prolyl cis-trans isomerase